MDENEKKAMKSNILKIEELANELGYDPQNLIFLMGKVVVDYEYDVKSLLHVTEIVLKELKIRKKLLITLKGNKYNRFHRKHLSDKEYSDKVREEIKNIFKDLNNKGR